MHKEIKLKEVKVLHLKPVFGKKNNKKEIKENFLNSKYDEKQKKKGSVSALPIMGEAELRCLNKLLFNNKMYGKSMAFYFVTGNSLHGKDSMEKLIYRKKNSKCIFFFKVFVERNAKMIP